MLGLVLRREPFFIPLGQLRPMICQRTLKSMTRAVGVGIHSGRKIELVLRPGAVNTGIVFRRTDLAQPVDIPVNPRAVCDTRMATTISPGGDPGAGLADRATQV